MKLLTTARDLKRRKARERSSLFVVEGVRAAEELLRSPIEVKGALVSPHLATTARGSALAGKLRATVPEVASVSEEELASAAQTDSPQGVLLLATQPVRALGDIDVRDGGRLLVLDAIQDPGNVGALLRTAAAFGVAATVALPGTVDLWNAKVVRSAMGMQFNHLCLYSTWRDLRQFLAQHAFVLWGAEPGANPPVAGEVPARVALAVGNEGAGLSADVRVDLSRSVGIPVATGVESLNVAVAAGILLWQITR